MLYIWQSRDQSGCEWLTKKMRFAAGYAGMTAHSLSVELDNYAFVAIVVQLDVMCGQLKVARI